MIAVLSRLVVRSTNGSSSFALTRCRAQLLSQQPSQRSMLLRCHGYSSTPQAASTHTPPPPPPSSEGLRLEPSPVHRTQNYEIGVFVALLGAIIIGGSAYLHAMPIETDNTVIPPPQPPKLVKGKKKIDPHASPSAEVPSSAVKSAKESEAADEIPLPMRKRMEIFVRSLQSDISDALDRVEGPDGIRMKKDVWHRAEGGEGVSMTLQNGKVLEKAAVLVSVVHGHAPDRLMAQMRARGLDLKGSGYQMFAAGISLIVHPHNPNAPTVHLNYRYFELSQGEGEDNKPVSWWFGGGCDLTPSYLFEEDAEHFHHVIKDACDRHDSEYYPRFKKWCDEYFNIPHRGERRGVGGIFFDDLDDRSPDELFAFVKDCGRAFIAQYIPIVEKRKDMQFTQQMKDWQQLRRGRYVEFNLVHDRGTKFGLATPGARIESVLCSLPMTARWEYMHTPAEGSEEAKLIEVLKNPREWV